MQPISIERIERSCIPVPECGCWLWLRRRDSGGYGQVGKLGQFQTAHRASYRAFKGPIPDGMLVCHKCDTPSCVNPDHLFLGTHKDNARDKIAKGRHGRNTHCTHDRTLERANLPNGQCRECNRAASRRIRARKKEARELARIGGAP